MEIKELFNKNFHLKDDLGVEFTAEANWCKIICLYDPYQLRGSRTV